MLFIYFKPPTPSSSFCHCHGFSQIFPSLLVNACLSCSKNILLIYFAMITNLQHFSAFSLHATCSLSFIPSLLVSLCLSCSKYILFVYLFYDFKPPTPSSSFSPCHWFFQYFSPLFWYMYASLVINLSFPFIFYDFKPPTPSNPPFLAAGSVIFFLSSSLFPFLSLGGVRSLTQSLPWPALSKRRGVWPEFLRPCLW